MKRTLLGLSTLSVAALTLLSACSSNKAKGTSEKTGWNYNDSRLGGFDVAHFSGQVTGPGLVFVEGGRFVMGQTDEDIYQEANSIPRTVTVSSYYIDETEVANVDYREYLYYLQRTYGSDYPEVIQKALPDTTVWRAALSFNEPLVKDYFRHAAYNFYPVVGVTWYQANDYCAWRTDRVNEMIMIKNGMMKKNPNQVNEDAFNTEAYVADQYLGLPGRGQKRDLDPNGAGKRNSNYADGLLLPDYRLPTEAEWEFAALAIVEKNPSPRSKRRRGEEALTDGKNYPWGDNRSTRDTRKGSSVGQYMDNYQRGRGDLMGVPGGLNDNASRPAEVKSYAANALGIYNMAGNVSEWVLDVYRPTTDEYDRLNPYRGNEFFKSVYEDDGTITEKDSLGKMVKVPVTTQDLEGRYDRDYLASDARGVSDGDTTSNFTYDYGKTTLINDNSRVIKGGSYRDRAYWLSPGTRRFMQAGFTSSTVGFRCVMDRLGSESGNNTPSGNSFSNRRRR